MEREDDVQLIYDILSGDETAFSVLVQKYQKSVHALVWRKIGDFHHAEEITQDIFLQVHKKLPTLKDPRQFTGWLYVIANRFCIDWRRKKKFVVQSIEDTPTAEIEKSAYTRYMSEQRQAEASERRRETVKKLLAQLPESERTVVTLYYLGEMKVKEISKFLGVSVSTLNTRLHRARERLQGKASLVQEVLGGVSETFLTSTTGKNSEMHERNIELCTQNLLTIGKAIQTYQKEHDDFPERLSDLHPKYLPEASVFICPADDEDGKAGFLPNIDLVAIGKIIGRIGFLRDIEPRMPVSYGYELAPEYRAKKIEQRLVFGDVIPLVRCWHHVNGDSEVLNLSFSSQIYRSSKIWEHTPEDMYGSHEAALTAIEEILARPPDDKRYPDGKRFFDLYPQLVRLYTLLGNEQSAAALIERLKSGMIQDLQGYQVLFDIFKTVERYEDLLAFFQVAEQQYPDDKFIFYKLADIHRQLGNTELAEVYERKSNPRYELVGKPVPDFSVIDLDGNPISLREYRGKVVLLHFWMVWRDFGTAETSDIKKVYDTYKDAGFDIIGVCLDSEAAIMSGLRNYIKVNGIQWRQIFDAAAYSLLQQYDVAGTPELWLIDREGRLITHKAKAENLEMLVAEAVKAHSQN
ncbi:MAG: sigma-70 family RNA polymerase sigma factor [Candidatus Poribacteria bacterium]|nr:sigma-70 family RNA polymerase sigma factor [Candidatus Poribacteria bacterium]